MISNLDQPNYLNDHALLMSDWLCKIFGCTSKLLLNNIDLHVQINNIKAWSELSYSKFQRNCRVIIQFLSQIPFSVSRIKIRYFQTLSSFSWLFYYITIVLWTLKKIQCNTLIFGMRHIRLVTLEPFQLKINYISNRKWWNTEAMRAGKLP